MPRMTGAEAIVRSLLSHGVDTLFGLPGVQNDALFNALFDAEGAIRVIHSRHEQGAAYMALGYAAASGKPGCYAVVPGPGLLNTTAALSTAYAINAKVLCLTGQIPSAYIGRGLGLLHEIPDQLGVLRSLTKWAERIESPAQVPAKVGEAFRQLHTGRPRPVGLEMAMDIMALSAEVELLPAPSSYGEPPCDPDAVADAARLLGKAKAPLVLVGGGALEASQEIAAIAELLQAPVIASPMGRGILSSRHYLSHTMPAGHRLWAKADAVLAVGTRLFMPQLFWGLDKALQIVRIDIDPVEHNRFAPPAVSIVADSRDGLSALLAQLPRHNRRRVSRKDELTALQREMEREFSRLQPQMAYLETIRQELPDDGIFVDELTQIGYVSRFALPVYQPRTFLTSGYQGTLGWGLACAVGVKLANPGRPVLAIAGDGGFLFNVQELATAVQHRVDLVMLVFNDGAYGNVKRMQQDLYENRVIASDLHNPDFVKLAQSFGAEGLRATTPEELRAALRVGFNNRGPTLIEIPVGEMPSPWPFIHLPRLRGEAVGDPPV